jgi:hypothetical protein
MRCIFYRNSKKQSIKNQHVDFLSKTSNESKNYFVDDFL